MALKTVWLRDRTSNVSGLLLDITGVLYESGTDGGKQIPGSVEAIDRLRKAGVPFKFLSNETQASRRGIVEKLRKLGFSLCIDDVMTPCPAVVSILREQSLRPHLLVHPNALPEFKEIATDNPNCVVIGDAAHHLSYGNVNAVFRTLMSQQEKVLFTLGRGKFYQEDGELTLDVGAYAAALEYACGTTARVVGKPSADYFLAAVKALNLEPSAVAMIGDDIESDVHGAQLAGMRGILVRTGKFRPANETHPVVKPDAIVDNLAIAVSNFLSG